MTRSATVWLFASTLGCGPVVSTSADEGTTSTSSAPSSDGGEAPSTGHATTEAGSTMGSTTSTTSSDSTSTGDVGTSSDAVLPDVPTCDPVPCGGAIGQCNDREDNDGDGLVDLDDPECTGPCDDDEGSFQFDMGDMNECEGAPTCTSQGECTCGEVCQLGCCRPEPPG
jgi:hypothetical protein